jgi:hypothetical protein
VTTAIQLPSNHSRHQRLAVLYPLRTFMVRWASPIVLHLTSIRRSNDWINISLFLGLQLSMSYLSIIINHHFSWRYSSINYGGITIVLMDTEIDDNWCNIYLLFLGDTPMIFNHQTWPLTSLAAQGNLGDLKGQDVLCNHRTLRYLSSGNLLHSY